MDTKFLQTHKSYIIAILISMLFFAVLSFFYTQTRLFDDLENGTINFRFFLRDPSEKARKLQEGVKISTKNPRARDDIIILGIDENTIREFGEAGILWPFPWNIHAKFTRFVGSGKPGRFFSTSPSRPRKLT